MNRDTFRGLIAGVAVALAVGWVVLFVINLGNRVKSIENFLNQAVANQQRAQVPPVK